MFALHEDPGAQRVAWIQDVAGIGLQAGGFVAPGDVGSDAVVDEVANRIGRVVDPAGSVEQRDLVVKRGRDLALIRWLAFRFSDAGGVTPSRVNCGASPGRFGISKRLLAVPNMKLTRLSAFSR